MPVLVMSETRQKPNAIQKVVQFRGTALGQQWWTYRPMMQAWMIRLVR
jgi:hypothetical protein